MRTVRRGWALVIGCSLFGLAAVAPAQNIKEGPPPSQLTGLLACRAITGDAARLACFDGAAKTLGEAVSRRDVVVFDRESVKKAKRGLFGFSIPNLGIFGEDDDGVEIKQVDGVIAGLGHNADGGYIFRLADGSRWTQTDGKPFALEPRGNDKVVIKKGALGSYSMSVAGQPGVKVKRLN